MEARGLAADRAALPSETVLAGGSSPGPGLGKEGRPPLLRETLAAARPGGRLPPAGMPRAPPRSRPGEGGARFLPPEGALTSAPATSPPHRPTLQRPDPGSTRRPSFSPPPGAPSAFGRAAPSPAGSRLLPSTRSPAGSRLSGRRGAEAAVTEVSSFWAIRRVRGGPCVGEQWGSREVDSRMGPTLGRKRRPPPRCPQILPANPATGRPGGAGPCAGGEVTPHPHLPEVGAGFKGSW
ncbi:proline-rich protein HaeIII subfamily 1-like [Artibeus jamaicensis]|uniref:proline-rich protein HaeIII subfamily 1-like n=1 Tax=Artibeus jamaicensis TaxID=9417 RepID=UPI00235ACF4A|nr:proline-rich protein HaeIII subfamily 1-like [Artibeus jamaicensis]